MGHSDPLTLLPQQTRRTLSHQCAALALLKNESMAGMQIVAAAIAVALREALHPSAEVCPTLLVPIPQKNIAGAPVLREWSEQRSKRLVCYCRLLSSFWIQHIQL